MIKLQSEKLSDILFPDLMMPLKDGYECLKEIRQERRLSHLPIVVCSISSLQADVNAAYALGANLFYNKPWNFNDYVNGLKILFHLDWQNPSGITTGQYLQNKCVAPDPLL